MRRKKLTRTKVREKEWFEQKIAPEVLEVLGRMPEHIKVRIANRFIEYKVFNIEDVKEFLKEAWPNFGEKSRKLLTVELRKWEQRQRLK